MPVLAVLLALFALPGLGAESRTGVVVFGSYADPARAEREQERLGAVLGLELRVVGAVRDGLRRHRVVTATLPEAAARREIE